MDIYETGWRARAACCPAEAEEHFIVGPAQIGAKSVCTRCPVQTECLAYALDNRVEHGVWGAMTALERRALLLRRPHIASWRHLLESARSQHQQRKTLPASTRRSTPPPS
ncbi:WhiB family transcriptional regulator [Streptomyces sp. NPDC005533]|uniref:WhiB family transcriptional regulator n=1 Tax=Streptomyces sp. NPDC005533 TaxID=3364723 RepID=UPI0036953B43